MFKQASSQVDPNFTWGPTMTQTYTDVPDGFGAAVGGSGTLLDALKTGQQKTIDALKAQSILRAAHPSRGTDLANGEAGSR